MKETSKRDISKYADVQRVLNILNCTVTFSKSLNIKKNSFNNEN